eukprot:TRINITY_DN7943_c0_g1_i1.p1 TRINITY_DN7943_c0_g1~~TRINITY_DN7943_c0_g1_i1.p1  ORF type:complete len:387 (+),score=43.25 TRINITY_DN7943_c0_g1_i1:434-1594(+)
MTISETRYFKALSLHKETIIVFCMSITLGMISVSWSPFASQCHVEKKTNIHNLYSTKIPAAHRALTFDGPENLSLLSIFCNHIENFVSNLLHAKIVKACKSICEHMQKQSKGEISVKRMSLLFKVDGEDRLALILCTNLKAEVKAKLVVKTFVRHADPYIWETKYTTTQNELFKDKNELDHSLNDIIRSISPKKPIKRSISATRKSTIKHCAFCSRNSSERWCGVRYKQIAEMHSYCRPGEVPKPLQQLHPLLTAKEYERQAVQESWMNTVAPCCSACYYIIRGFSKQEYRHDPSAWNQKLKFVFNTARSKFSSRKSVPPPGNNIESVIRKSGDTANTLGKVKTSRNLLCSVWSEGRCEERWAAEGREQRSGGAVCVAVRVPKTSS